MSARFFIKAEHVASLRVGERVEYTNRGGWKALGTIIHREFDPSSGATVFDVRLDELIGGTDSYWGYAHQFKLIRLMRPLEAA